MIRKPFREMVGLLHFETVAEWISNHPQVLIDNQNTSMRLYFAARYAAHLSPVLVCPDFRIEKVSFNMRQPEGRFIYGDMLIAWSGSNDFNPFTGFESSGLVLTGRGCSTRDANGVHRHRYDVRFTRTIWHRMVTRMMLEAE